MTFVNSAKRCQKWLNPPSGVPLNVTRDQICSSFKSVYVDVNYNLKAYLYWSQADDDDLRRQFVNQFSQMSPGITTKLVKTLQHQNLPNSGETKTFFSTKVVQKCLHVWRRFVVSIFCDKNVEMNLSEFCSNQCQLLSDQTWMGKAQDHLMTHLQIFGQSFAAHSNVQLRKETFLICSDLVEFCSKDSLTNLHSLLFDILSTLSVDEESDEIRTKSRNSLRKLLDIFTEKQKDRMTEIDFVGQTNLLRPLVEQCQLEIFNLSEKFSVQAKTYDEFELNRGLAKLSGHLLLLKEIEESRCLFNSSKFGQKCSI